ncbi:MAG: hypothetical protein WBF33_06420, partial [Candidatus Nitrosopolaris sp.]
NDTSREVHEMFKTTAIDTLKQDKKCQACWYMILSTMSGSTTVKTTSDDAAIPLRIVLLLTLQVRSDLKPCSSRILFLHYPIHRLLRFNKK